ncbi:MAG: GNAT family acetyltransferase [Oscillospiraceae bacterium]
MANDFLVVNFKDMLEDEEIGEDKLKEILSDYSCPKNADVEHFLKCNSIEFTKKNQSVTYLVFGNEGNIVGYFSLAIKPISVRSDIFSNSVNRKISRVAELDEDGTTYSLSAYLIAQLGKNYTNSANETISGTELLDIALDTIRDIQHKAGGMVVFIEAERKDKLMKFYKDENRFQEFETRTIHKEDKEQDLVQMLITL